MQFLVVHKIALLLVAAAVVGVAAYMRHGRQAAGGYPVSPYSSTPPSSGSPGGSLSVDTASPYGGTNSDAAAASSSDGGGSAPVPDAVTTAAVAPADATSSSVYDGTQPASTSSYVGGGGPAGTIGPGGYVPINRFDTATARNAASYAANPALFDAPTTITPVAVPGTNLKVA